jgi:hypothetical protein
MSRQLSAVRKEAINVTIYSYTSKCSSKVPWPHPALPPSPEEKENGNESSSGMTTQEVL